MNAIPDDVRRFVLTSIPSVSYLEAALLLRECADQDCMAADVAGRLYVAERTAADVLQALCAAGLVQSTEDASYRYAPRDEALARSMEVLADCYAADLVGISNLIHDATQKSAQRFADAFKLRKDT
jgi:Mn-dependent DtxR family transcriptional regulator